MKHNTREWLLRASCIVIMMMAMLTSALAQPKGERFDPQEFRAHLEGFISKEAGLTASEGKAFFPLFHEMKEKQRKIQDEIFRLKRNSPAGNASDKEFANAIQRTWRWKKPRPKRCTTRRCAKPSLPARCFW